jgi:hypothetical protein
MGIPSTGATLDWIKINSRPPEAQINASFAKKLWGAEDALGKTFRLGPESPSYAIAGVVGDVRANGIERPPTDIIYLPLLSSKDSPLWHTPNDMFVTVRSNSLQPDRVISEARRILAQIGGDIPISDVRTIDDIVVGSLGRTSFTALLVEVAGGVTLFLSLMGVYGVMSYLVAERRSEIGMRIALGASGLHIYRQILLSSAQLAGAGIAVGLLIVVSAGSILRSMLYGVTAYDPSTLVLSSLGLLALALGAGFFPARRAMRIDPTEALRVK